MKPYSPLLIIIAFVLLAGCLGIGQNNTQNLLSSSKIDLAITGFNPIISSNQSLGSSFPLMFNISSTEQNAEYNAIVKLNGHNVYTHIFSGNISRSINVPALYDGNVNLTMVLYVKDSKHYFDINASNNFISKAVHISPLGMYKNTSFDNSTNVHQKRSYATKISLENNATISTIGAFIRQTAVLSSNSTFSMLLHPDLNGTPQNTTLINMTTKLSLLSQNWRLVLLASPSKSIPAGTYWLEFYVYDRGFAEIACTYENETGKNLAGARIGKGLHWKNQTCTPYTIISSQSPPQAYNEFSRNT